MTLETIELLPDTPKGSEPIGKIYRQNGEMKYTNKDGATWVFRTVQSAEAGTMPVWAFCGWLNL